MKVIGSPAGQASADFSLPFNDLELENLFLRLGRVRESIRRFGTTNNGAAIAFGRRLFEAAFKDEVRLCLARSLDKAWPGLGDPSP
ncbi:MAG TPA: hypothetical protein VGM86_19895 [Thermoanaerobaculia bacterium]